MCVSGSCPMLGQLIHSRLHGSLSVRNSKNTRWIWIQLTEKSDSIKTWISDGGKRSFPFFINSSYCVCSEFVFDSNLNFRLFPDISLFRDILGRKKTKMKTITVILCALGLFVNFCKADHYRDRDFNDRDRDTGDRDFHDRDRHRDREIDHERDRDRNRNDPRSLFCKDLNSQVQLDMEQVSICADE